MGLFSRTYRELVATKRSNYAVGVPVSCKYQTCCVVALR